MLVAMRVVAAGDTYWKFEGTKKLLSEIGKAILLFAEGSLDSKKDDAQDWTIEDIAKYTKHLPMTIIGEKNGRVHIVKKGQIIKAQLDGAACLSDDENEKLRYLKADQLYNVSYTPKRKVLALSRICADADTPYEGAGKADLLLLPTADDLEDRLGSIIQSHKEHLKPNALIVQCVMHEGGRFIYSLSKKRKVGKTLRDHLGSKYVVYDW